MVQLIEMSRNYSKYFDICPSDHFMFKFSPDICGGCHDVNIHGTDYCCIISSISKSEAINFIQNFDLSEKSGTL